MNSNVARLFVRGFAAKFLLLMLCAGAAAAQSASFQTPVGYPAQKGPLGMATADFNGDGKLDLAVGNAASSSVSIFLGKGDGTFTANGSAVIPNSCNATQIIAGDFNNDGRQDALVICSFQTALWFLPGTGTGQFGTPVVTTLPAVTFNGFIEVTAQTAAVADFNGDGNLDLVVSLINEIAENAGAIPLEILLGKGDGTFQAPSTVLSGTVMNGESATVAFSVASADLDGDGTPDLAVSAINVADVNSLDCETSTPNDVLLILHGNGDGTFQATETYDVANAALLGTLAVSDLNGDGIPDIVVAGLTSLGSDTNAGQSTVAVYLGTGGGNFKPAFDAIENSVITDVLAGDFRGTGTTDLLEVSLQNLSGDSSTVTTALSTRAGNGDGTFQNPIALTGAPWESSVIAADWNGDGLIDIAFPSDPALWTLVASDNNVDLNNPDTGQLSALISAFYQELPQSDVYVMLNSATPPPVLTSVQNPGSNVLPGLPNYGIAQGSVFVVYGENLSSSTLTTTASLPYTASLANTSINVTVGGTTVNCLMVYTYRSQVAAILPSNTPAGAGTLTLTYNGKSGSIPITVIASGFGMLSQNETGVGPAVATHADNSPVTNTNAAFPNEEVVLWGTGLGPLPAGVSDASSPLGAGANIGTITVFVGGVPANVVYHGRNPSDPGLDQININIPEGVNGCYVSLVVQSGNYVSNTTTLAISPSQSQKTCSDANGISVSSLSNALGSTGSATIGSVLLTSETQASGSTAFATAEFEKYTQLQLNETTAMVPFPSVGSCTVSISNSAKPAPVLGGSGIYAGGLTLTPPSGSVISLIPRPVFGAGYYSSAGVTSLPAGSYQVVGTTGKNVGGFNTSLNLPVKVTWTNQASVAGSAITRANPLTISWSGGSGSGFVVISGASSNPNSAGISIGAAFTCVAPAAAGSFTIPPSVLLSLPASASGGTSSLAVGSASAPQTFSASGLTTGYAIAESASGSVVIWK